MEVESEIAEAKVMVDVVEEVEVADFGFQALKHVNLALVAPHYVDSAPPALAAENTVNRGAPPQRTLPAPDKVLPGRGHPDKKGSPSPILKL